MTSINRIHESRRRELEVGEAPLGEFVLLILETLHKFSGLVPKREVLSPKNKIRVTLNFKLSLLPSQTQSPPANKPAGKERSSHTVRSNGP